MTNDLKHRYLISQCYQWSQSIQLIDNEHESVEMIDEL